MQKDDLLRKVLDRLEELKVPYAVVGSFASSAYGEGRHTQDVDILVDLRYGDVNSLCDAFQAPEYYVSPEAARQAIKTGSQFNIVESSTGDKADMIIPKAGTWETDQISARRKMRILPDRDAYVARPEHIILSKMLWYKEGGSEKHLRDIAGMLKISGNQIDFEYISQWAKRLDVEDVWQAAQRRIGKSSKPQ
jgi:hypothetical protein